MEHQNPKKKVLLKQSGIARHALNNKKAICLTREGVKKLLIIKMKFYPYLQIEKEAGENKNRPYWIQSLPWTQGNRTHVDDIRNPLILTLASIFECALFCEPKASSLCV